MEKRIIEYLEKYYCIALNIIYLLFFTIVVVMIIEKDVFMALLIILIIIGFIFLSIVFYNYNIVFDYKKQSIKVLEPGHFRSLKFNMKDVKGINFYEVKTKKMKSIFLHETRRLYNFNPSYVYNNGKQYLIEIIVNNGNVEKISYNSLYKCKNINTIKSFEEKMNLLIKEFNAFKHKKP